MAAESMFQSSWVCINDRLFESSFPRPKEEVVPGVHWGRVDELFTPAFWKHQAQCQMLLNRYTSHRLGETLVEEVAACLLGGYGIPAELGLAAYRRIRNSGLLSAGVGVENIEATLKEPFHIDGRAHRYRFARQKSLYLSEVLAALEGIELPSDDLALRDCLLRLPGIGPKTASWIVRNYTNSSNVAIIDVHLLRACQRINLFDKVVDPHRNYFQLEAKFLNFCRALSVPASVLDALIWDYMRRIGPTARQKQSG